MPVDCISAYIVVGPTKRKPRARSALLIAVDSGVTARTSAKAAGAGLAGGAKDHSRASSSAAIDRSSRR